MYVLSSGLLEEYTMFPLNMGVYYSPLTAQLIVLAVLPHRGYMCVCGGGGTVSF